METRRAKQYVFTGVLHWYFQNIQAGGAIHSHEAVPGVAPQLEEYLGNLAALDMRVTLDAVWVLNGIKDALAATADDAVLSDADASRIRIATGGAQQALYSEAATKQLFVTTEKRFPVEKLLYDVGALLRAGTYNRLPVEAAIDLYNATRCLAFECETASAFHALRATEATLRHYYSCVVRRNRLPAPWMWAAMTAQMGRRRNPPPAALLANLDSLRNNFRNPTAHPEKHYDLDEAQDLLGGCLDVINRMVQAPEWVDPPQTWGEVLEQFDALQQAQQAPAPADAVGP